MVDPEDAIATILRESIEERISMWKAERRKLQRATERLAELEALIAFAEDETKQTFKVAPPSSRAEKDDTPIRDRQEKGDE